MSNSGPSHSSPELDDVALRPPEKNLDLKLDEVGMENVQTQIRVKQSLLPAKCQASVSLIDRHARGIHMSRLFKIINQLSQEDLSWPWLKDCLTQMLESHGPLSDSGHLSVAYELPVQRKALVSAEQGWRTYPLVQRISSVKGALHLSLTVRVLYSSTCPCSAGLSRQALQERFVAEFQNQDLSVAKVSEWLSLPSSMAALPHSQRSEAICEFTLNPGIRDAEHPEAIELIDAMEAALGTPVQAAVKREDEQEFARLNAQNLMFCEDAARKLKAALLLRKDLADFKIEVRHFESLHAHDVVAKVQKNT